MNAIVHLLVLLTAKRVCYLLHSKYENVREGVAFFQEDPAATAARRFSAIFSTCVVISTTYITPNFRVAQFAYIVFCANKFKTLVGNNFRHSR